MGSRKNYSAMSTKGIKVPEAEASSIAQGTVSTTQEIHDTPEVKKGVVFNCERLNVRSGPSPDANVSIVINKGDEVEINNSTEDFYHIQIRSKNISGWCMKQFIALSE